MKDKRYVIAIPRTFVNPAVFGVVSINDAGARFEVGIYSNVEKALEDYPDAAVPLNQ
jgi:hypothetical protein